MGAIDELGLKPDVVTGMMSSMHCLLVSEIICFTEGSSLFACVQP